MERPVYLIFAGVNGAGKSTLYNTDFWQTDSLTRSLPRINSDEILVEQGGDPTSLSDQLHAGRAALQQLDDCFERGLSFNQETTLTGHKCIRTIERAREAGYRIIMFYVGVSSSDLALKRIAHRGLLGGHVIEDDVVRHRWHASLSNLSRAVRLCDEVSVIDNSIRFVPIARWDRGALSWAGNLKTHGAWFAEAVFDDGIWKT